MLKFTQKEQKIRQFWLYSLYAALSYSVLAVGVFSFMLKKHIISREVFSNSSANTMMSLLWGYIYYICAYKKHGIKFLTFNLFLTPFSILFILFILRYGMFPKIESIMLLGSIGISLIFFYYSLRLRKVNLIKNLEFLEVEAQKQNLLISIEKAKNLEELEQNFLYLLKMRPRFRQIFLKYYKKRRKELTL